MHLVEMSYFGIEFLGTLCILKLHQLKGVFPYIINMESSPCIHFLDPDESICSCFHGLSIRNIF